MPYFFDCKLKYVCSAPSCGCPREFKKSNNMEKELSEEQKEALDLVDKISKHTPEFFGQPNQIDLIKKQIKTEGANNLILTSLRAFNSKIERKEE